MEKPVRNSSLTLTVLALCGAAFFAGSLLIPIIGAVFLALLFLPWVRNLKKRGIPTPVSSFLIVIFITFVLGIGLLALGEATQRWAQQAPETIERIEKKIQGAKGPLTDLSEATSRLEEITSIDKSAPKNSSVDVESPWRSGKLLGHVFSSSMNLFLGLGICLVLTLFLLASGDNLERGLINASPDFPTKRRAIEAKRELESTIGRFLTARSVINLGLGLVLWPLFHTLGVTNSLQWAVTAAILNFIPYLGSVILCVLLIAAGMVTQETLWAAILPALAFAIVNSIEGMLVSPIVIGRWMKLNSIAVFLSVVILGWFWGIAGAIMAVPILVTFATICGYTERWQFLAVVISGRKNSDTQNAD